MPMREDCKHFQSRTYSSGEAARFCILDLAPEAPWRCPDNCPKYERRLADVGWDHGKLREPELEPEPPVPGDEVAALLDQAEDIVNAVVPTALDEVRRNQAKGKGGPTGGAGRSGSPSWRRLFRRGR